MESNRQKKISGIIQEEIAYIFRVKIPSYKGVLITISDVKVTSDLSIAKIYISIFPTNNRDSIFKDIVEQTPQIRKELGIKVSKIMRQIPQLHFFCDTSLDQIDQLEKELKGKGDNPIL